MLSKLVLIASAVAACVAPATAALITPTGATASSFYARPNSTIDTRGPDHVIDNSGLIGTKHVNRADNFNHEGDAGDVDGTMWLSNGATATGEWIQFSLGAAPVSLAGMHVWNYNEGAFPDSGNTPWYFRGIKDVLVRVSTDGGQTFDAGQQFIFGLATGSSDYAGTDYSFATPRLANAVRFTVISSHTGDAEAYGAVANEGVVGLAEVKFNSVPEPASLGWLGLVAVCGLKRRR